MSDYLTLGHMRIITEEDLRRTDCIVKYIPYQGIWQQGDDGDRLRVVFDAFRPTSSGWSLNDILHCGPKQETEAWVVLLRWRTRRVGFATDVEMIFRGIWLDERDVDLHRTLWSPSEEEPQLCNDDGKDYTEAIEAFLKDRYVDDILTGAHEVEVALRLQDHLIKLMKAGGFRLRKCVSNQPELLKKLDASDSLRPTWISFSTDNPVRELVIASAKQAQNTVVIFDPCGWLAPATLMIKLLIQDLGRAGLDWDEIFLPRWIFTGPQTNNTAIYAFSDAGRRAMASVVYSPTSTTDDTGIVNLLVAKTRLFWTESAGRNQLLTQSWTVMYVHQIQELSPPTIWRYVPSELIPPFFGIENIIFEKLPIFTPLSYFLRW
ncbi:uncharacterized protein LOC117170746 [Belonocnema kinseyi]|uniref:uncharacterized protein LOC117170746 n=1 Tax=Belonocnema kinseyi TaxID=2817044 RepID=UPI00143E017B|nr:uncharacterized protein LOC117170746 [Belonocnema kinseyi]